MDMLEFIQKPHFLENHIYMREKIIKLPFNVKKIAAEF
jgi:hypothetical protein